MQHSHLKIIVNLAYIICAANKVLLWITNELEWLEKWPSNKQGCQNDTLKSEKLEDPAL